MVTKISTLDMSEDEWLEERKKSLGGSDVGAVLGMNPYRSPYSVWAEKTGRLPPKEDNEAMRQGRDLENYVAERFCEKAGKSVQRMNFILRNDGCPYLHANIDRRIIGEDSGLECKTASALNMGAYQNGEFPESYYAQCVAYLAVTGWSRWYLAALILNRAFHIYQLTTIKDDIKPEWCESSVYVSPEEIETLKHIASSFWETYIITDTQPPADGTMPTGDALQTIYAGQNDGCVELFGREQLLADYFTLSDDKKGIERQMEKIKQTLQQDMGEASTGTCTGYKVTWKAQERRTFDTNRFAADHVDMDLSPYYKSSISRVMRINQNKEKREEK